MRKFKLLKDLPNLKAGAIFHNETPNGDDYFVAPVNTEKFNRNDHIRFSLKTLTKNPDWFEEVKEDKKFSIPIILISLLRADGFILAGILLIAHYNTLNLRLETFYGTLKARLKKIYPLILIFVSILMGIITLRYIIYKDLFPNTYYLKLGYSFTDRISRGFQTQNLTLLFAPYQYIIPIALLFAYNVFIGGDAWEGYGFLNRFLILAIPLLYESVNFKELFLIKIFGKWKNNI